MPTLGLVQTIENIPQHSHKHDVQKHERKMLAPTATAAEPDQHLPHGSTSRKT